jgi:chromate transporter
MLIKLALMFSKLCVFAFGGGYVMIPIMLHELEVNHWASISDLTDVVAIAGISPGPIAVNAAVGLGYKVAGFPGVMAAFLGIVIPNSILVIIVAIFFFKICAHPRVKDAFYGLRPAIVGIILFAAVSFALKNGILLPIKDTLIQNGFNISLWSMKLFELKSVIIAAFAFFLMLKFRIHPILVIITSGLAGIWLF